MTEFEFRRTEKVIVHDLSEMNLEQFTTMILTNHKHTAMWSEGLLMFIIPSPTTDPMIESMRDGKEEHLLSVMWCKYDVYENEIPGIGGMKIGVVEAVSPFISELARWIKDNPNGD